MRLPILSRRRAERALRTRDEIIERTEDALANTKREAHDEIDQLIQQIVDDHIASRHPGQPCRSGLLNRCILGAPPEEVAEEEAARQRYEQRCAEERKLREPLEVRQVWWCPSCHKEYASGFGGHGQAENGCGALTPVTITVTRRKVDS